MNTTDNINYIADEGKVFIRNSDNVIVGWGIGIGDKDDINNYTEIECPQEFKGDGRYDNTIEEEEPAPREGVVLKQNMFMLKRQINNTTENMNETLKQRLMNMYNQLMQKMQESNSNNQQQTTNAN